MLYKQLKSSPDLSLLAAVPDQEHLVKIIDPGNVIALPSVAHDVAWYPWVAYRCLLTCTRAHGLQLWNDSAQLASYVAMNEQEDRLVNMIAGAFTPTGHHIFSVGSNRLYQFDLQRTGKPINTMELGKSLSAISIRPDDTGLMAVGSFCGDITLLNQDNIIHTINLQHGISQLHLEGWNLIGSSRNDPRLMVWDLRNLENNLHVFDRGPVAANQRMYWAVKGDYVYTGDKVGEVKRCNITTGECNIVHNFNCPIAALAFHNLKLVASLGDRQNGSIHSLNKITID